MKRPVIFIVESGGLCGGVRQIFEQAARLFQRGWQVSVYSLDQQPAWFALPTGIQWRQFPDYRTMQTVLITEDSWKIATWWKTAHALKDALRGDEGLYLVADIETWYYTQPAMQEMVLETYSYPLRRYTESRWVEANLPDTTWIGIGIDCGLYQPMGLQRKPNSLLAIARPQRLKGFKQLGELSRRLGPKFELYTLGPTPVRFIGAWRRHYSGLSDQEVVRLYNEVGCVISTSLHEGFGLPHIEAMATGTPLITSDADSNMEFCKHGENCLVMDRFDMRSMAHGVRRMLSDKELRKRCIANGFETAKKYPWGPVIDRLERFLT